MSEPRARRPSDRPPRGEVGPVRPAEAGTGAAGDPGSPGTFRIDREGTWRHEGVEVTHPGVLRNLYANLRADASGYHLQAGPLRVPVQVDDTPFVVVRVEAGSDPGAIAAYLSDGSQEPLDPATLMLDRRGIPYCRVKDGRFRARLAVPAWLQLAGKVEPDPESGQPILILGSRRVSLNRTP
jgi:hypothetical protein